MTEQFEDFFNTVDSCNQPFVLEINDYLLENGCKCEIKSAKSGYVVSYILLKTKRTLATFVCRKSGMKLRMYLEHIAQYEAILNSFPDAMKKEIRKASDCKRLINPDDCNPRCIMGYDFNMDDEHFQKCRNMAFLSTLSAENNPFIYSILKKEVELM